jgi:hypothetical protein
MLLGRTPKDYEKSQIFLIHLPEVRLPSLIVIFLSTHRRWSPQSIHKYHKTERHVILTIFHAEIIATPTSPRQLGGTPSKSYKLSHELSLEPIKMES